MSNNDSDVPPPVLVIPTLKSGGAESYMARMANWWAERETDVKLVSFLATAEDYALSPLVKRITLDGLSPTFFAGSAVWPQEAAAIGRLRTAFLRILEGAPFLRQSIPVLSFLPRMNMRTLIAARGLPLHVVVAERSFPPSLPLQGHEEALRRILYAEAAALVVQTEYCAVYWGYSVVPKSRCHVIPNCVFTAEPEPEPLRREAEATKPYFLAVGRLAKEKRHDLFLQAAASVARDCRVRFVIAGQGPLEQKLRMQSEKLGLQSGVTFIGHVANPATLMRKAHALVLCSDFEGFPNVLLEAMALGCPVISTDCRTGPREIIRHAIDGLLVPTANAKALAQAMRRLLCNRSFRDSLSENAPDVLRRFAEEKIMRRWMEILYRRA